MDDRFAVRAAVVARLQATGFHVRDDRRPEGFALTDEQRVGVPRGFVLDERRVDPAHHDRNPSTPELRGDLVRARRLRREGRQADEIGLDIAVVARALDLLVDQFDGPVRRRDRGDVPEGERLPQIVAVERDGVAWIDENQLHAAGSIRCSARPTCWKIAIGSATTDTSAWPATGWTCTLRG